MADIVVVNAPGDSPNSGRTKWNANHQAVNEEIVQVHADLDAHLESGVEHDGRYYTKEDIDTLQENQDNVVTGLDEQNVKLSGEQEIAGKKTFTTSPEVKTGESTSGIILRSDAYGNTGQCKVESWAYSAYHALKLLLNAATVENPNWQQILTVKSNDNIARFLNDVYAGGKKLATENYVAGLIKSGRYAFEAGMRVNVGGSVTMNFTEHGTGSKRFLVPESSRLIKVCFGWHDTTHSQGTKYSEDVDVYFDILAHDQTVIRPELVLVAGEISTIPTLNLYAENFLTGAQTSDLIYSKTLQGCTLAGYVEFYCSLLLTL